jgi:thiol-disulfide isomerase/thioredoxin
MKLFYFCLFTFAFLLSSACRPAAAPVSVSNKPVSINNIPQTNLPMPPSKPIEEMNWTRFDGGGVQNLGELKGKVVVLDFWATYCPPCIKEIPHLNELQAKYGAENLQIVGLHVGGEEDRALIPDFVKETPIKYPLATPENALSQFVFGNESAIPQTAVFDQNGNFVRKFMGFDDRIKEQLDSTIEEVVNKK